MAFRTNKVPAIEERTVSGSSVSFNSAFALPLKACKVRVNIKQSGSGTPTLLNRRPFVNISSLGITHNNILSNVPLGNDYYDFELDLNTGILTSYWYVFRADEYTWRESGTMFYCTDPSYIYRPELVKKNGTLNIKSDVYDTSDTNDLSVYGNIQNRSYYIKDTQYLGNITAFKTHLTNDNVMLAFELATPITIQLSPTQLSSIIGNNTFSTDTGTLEITFADLQEKSASGSVASFNTALAMPLVNGEFTIQAYQEGSGDPAPDNVRNIVGYSALNMYKSTENLFDPSYIIENGFIRSDGIFQQAGGAFGAWNATDFIEVSGDTTYLFNPNSTGGNSAKHAFYNATKGFISTIDSGKQLFTTPSNARYMRFSFRATSEDIQLLDPEVKTKALGETVYGGSYNSVTGKFIITHEYRVYKGDLSEPWTLGSASGMSRFNLAGVSDIKRASTVLCNYLKNDMSTIPIINTIRQHPTNILAVVFFDTNLLSENTLAAWRTYLSEHNLEVVFELETPIEIQLTPTQIETIIGNNTIFADTGDVDLTYKDLDIAKRGNFREVFRLPS